MRRRAPILLLAMFTTLAAAAPATGGVSPGGETKCRIGLEMVGPHRIGFHTRCNYEQADIQLRPTGRLKGVDRSSSLSGRVDPEDGFACGRTARRVNCYGRAGSGARLDGVFRTVEPACEEIVDVTVFGGIDCDGPNPCPDIGYYSEAADLRPKGC